MGTPSQTRGFSYVSARSRKITDERTLDRIQSLVIPPAWTDVWINRDPRGHLQATGLDVRSRRQYIYHPAWRALRELHKFEQVAAFARALPRLRRAVTSSLRTPDLDRDKVSAIVVRLLETSLVRIGSPRYARDNGSYGLTTLKRAHARVKGSAVRLAFAGKSGIKQSVRVRDATLARVVSRLQELPGQVLFKYRDAEDRWRPLRSEDVNDYIRTHTDGDYTAKDFRTWIATQLAVIELAQEYTPPLETLTARRARVVEIVKSVAKRLGNTPAICRKSYIHPRVLDAFLEEKLPAYVPPAKTPARLSIRHTHAERFVLKFLEGKAKRASTPGQAARIIAAVEKSVAAR
ncbi:MAG: DNA topoisomerase IB [Opitutaceae bacterium]